MKNLLNSKSLDKDAIDFSLVNVEEFIPCLEESIEKAKANIEAYKKETANTFESVILDLESSSEDVDLVAEVFYFYHGVLSDDAFQEVSADFMQKLTVFSNDVGLDQGIFDRVKGLYDDNDLEGEQKSVLESYYKDFTRNGALLNTEDKEKLKKINQEQSQLSLNFSQNALKYNNAYFKHIADKELLDGLPEGALEAAAEEAKGRELVGYVVTLDYPSYLPVMTYAKSRELRKELYLAKVECANSGETNNKPLIKRSLELREQRAQLLGYKNHAEFVLERRMAQTPETVTSFIDKLLGPSLDRAKKDAAEIIEVFHQDHPGEKSEPWDRTYYAEKLKQQKLNFDENELRPYFSLNNVIDGAFQTAGKLYDIKFVTRDDLPKYHEDVQIFEVQTNDGEYVGLFYADFFPRKTKRSGAWMTNLKGQGLREGEVKRPHVAIVCNFTKPTASKPSLLTLNEVLTLFHEFGHALHGLLSKVTYTKLSGTSVYWDFVELPSQVMENWVYEKECLDLFAKHYETGESLPQELINKVSETKKFLAGLGSLRQLGLGTLDMKYHTTPASEVDVDNFEIDVFKDFDVFDSKNYGLMSCSFGHVFAGGYAAGYYSYKWAEVLDADAFEAFKEKGIFSKEVATAFKENVLSRGGTEHPMELYKKFRGSEPSVDALLKRSGLL